MLNKKELAYTATSSDEMEDVFSSIRREFKDKNGNIDISVSWSGDDATKPAKENEKLSIYVIFMHKYPQLNHGSSLKTKAYVLNDDADSAAGSYFLNLNGHVLNEELYQSLDDEHLNKLNLVENVTLYAGADVAIITVVRDLYSF